MIIDMNLINDDLSIKEMYNFQIENINSNEYQLYIKYLTIYHQKEFKKDKYSKEYLDENYILIDKKNPNIKIIIKPSEFIDIHSFYIDLKKYSDEILKRISDLIESKNNITDENRQEFDHLKKKYISFKEKLKDIDFINNKFYDEIDKLLTIKIDKTNELMKYFQKRTFEYSKIESMISIQLKNKLINIFKENNKKIPSIKEINIIAKDNNISSNEIEKWFKWIESSYFYLLVKKEIFDLEKNINNIENNYNLNTKYLTIDIPGTIVTKQIERPPFISELLDEEPRLYNVELHRADKEKFLNFSEKILSNMYSYGKFKLMNTDSKLLEIEEIIETDSFTAVSLIPDYYILLHGILKTISTDYQNNNSLSHRLSMVKTLYNELKEISNNPILDIKPLPDESLNIICNIMNIQVLLNNTIYGNSGQKVIIYNNYMIFTTNIYHLDEIPNIYENNCPPELDSTLSSDTTFSSFLNKAYKYNKRISK